MRRTKEEAMVTRQIILDSALKVFYEYGYNATSIKDICEEAGVTKGALYWHFQSKEELLRAVLEENTKQILVLGDYYRKKQMRPKEKMQTIYKSILEMIFSNKKMHMAIEIAVNKTEMKVMELTEEEKCAKEMFLNFTDIIEEGIKLGEFKDELTPKQYNFYINNVVAGLIWGSFELPEIVNLADWGETFLDITFKNILFKEGGKN